MSWGNRVQCGTCFRKMHGPDREPVRLLREHLSAEDRSERCHLCGGTADELPGMIYVRAWTDDEHHQEQLGEPPIAQESSDG